MGQYYAIYDKAFKTGDIRIWSLQSTRYRVTKDISLYNGIKLTEHSYFGTEVMDAFSRELYGSPSTIAWVGDYSDYKSYKESGYPEWKEKFAEDVLAGDVSKFSEHEIAYPMAYGNKYEKADSYDYEAADEPFDYEGKFAVNYSKEVAFRLTDAINEDPKKNWVLFPISLLTAVGNGLGGGDYHSKVERELIGTWAYDVISIEDECDVPENFEIIEAPHFNEE